MAAGTVVLAITAIFATKANKRFTTIGTAYTGVYRVHAGSDAFLTTTGSSSLNQLNMRLATISGTTYPLAAGALITINATPGSDKVYYR